MARFCNLKVKFIKQTDVFIIGPLNLTEPGTLRLYGRRLNQLTISVPFSRRSQISDLYYRSLEDLYITNGFLSSQT